MTRTASLLALLLTLMTVSVTASLTALPRAYAQDQAPARAVRVGLVTMTRVNLTPDEALSLATAMGRALERMLLVEARVSDAVLLPRGKSSAQCLIEDPCLAEVARRLEVDELLALAMVRVGDRVRIETRWLHAAGKRGQTQPVVMLTSSDDIDARLAEVAPSLLPKTEPRPVLEPKKPIGFQDGHERNDIADSQGSGDLGATPPPVERGRYMTGGAWIASGISVAALAGSVAMGLSARSRYDQVQSLSADTPPCAGGQCPPFVEDRIAQLRSRARLADVLLGAGAVSAAVAVVLYWRSDNGHGSAPAVGVATGSDSLVVTYGGRF